MNNRIKEIKERLNAVTPGKWKYGIDGKLVVFVSQIENGNKIIMAEGTFAVKEAEFIVNAPEDIVYLLEQVNRRCVWVKHGHEFITSCDSTVNPDEGDELENYCSFCGGRIEVKE